MKGLISIAALPAPGPGNVTEWSLTVQTFGRASETFNGTKTATMILLQLLMLSCTEHGYDVQGFLEAIGADIGPNGLNWNGDDEDLQRTVEAAGYPDPFDKGDPDNQACPEGYLDPGRCPRCGRWACICCSPEQEP